jgi:hypothetical protein
LAVPLIAEAGAAEVIGGLIIRAIFVATLEVAAEETVSNAHKNNKRKSTEQKHQEGEATDQRNKGGEKGDARRNLPKVKNPPTQPPKDSPDYLRGPKNGVMPGEYDPGTKKWH